MLYGRRAVKIACAATLTQVQHVKFLTIFFLQFFQLLHHVCKGGYTIVIRFSPCAGDMTTLKKNATPVQAKNCSYSHSFKMCGAVGMVVCWLSVLTFDPSFD